MWREKEIKRGWVSITHKKNFNLIYSVSSWLWLLFSTHFCLMHSTHVMRLLTVIRREHPSSDSFYSEWCLTIYIPFSTSLTLINLHASLFLQPPFIIPFFFRKYFDQNPFTVLQLPQLPFIIFIHPYSSVFCKRVFFYFLLLLLLLLLLQLLLLSPFLAQLLLLIVRLLPLLLLLLLLSLLLLLLLLLLLILLLNLVVYTTLHALT